MSAYISVLGKGVGSLGSLALEPWLAFWRVGMTKQMDLKGVSWAWGSHFTGGNRWGATFQIEAGLCLCPHP